MSPRIVTHTADSLYHVSFKWQLPLHGNSSRKPALPFYGKKTKASNFFKNFLETCNGLSYTNSICF